MTNIDIIQIEKSKLKELEINYSFYETVYGAALIASTEKGICYIGFGNRDNVIQSMFNTYLNAGFREKTDSLHRIALDFIENGSVEHIPLHIVGTDFQFAVWNALIDIPLGRLSTYLSIAKNINNPKAVRAVGSAVGSNPVSYIIPCHRVIRTDGGLGGYHWGLEFKEKMLEREKQLAK